MSLATKQTGRETLYRMKNNYLAISGRQLAFVLAINDLSHGLPPLFFPNEYNRDLYYMINKIFDPSTWGLMWTFAGLSAILYAVHGGRRPWLLTISTNLLLTILWCVALVYDKASRDVPVSWGGLGLWLTLLTLLYVIVRAEQSVVRKNR